MGKVIPFHDARTSAPSDSARASKVMSGRPFSAAKWTNAAQRDAGIPLARQVLTVLGGTPRASETAPVPPKASIAESGVSDMDGNIVRSLRTSQEFAKRETTENIDCGPIGSMIDPPEIIAARLKALRLALDFRTQKAFADKLGIEKNTYNPFEKGTRELTFETACLIRKRFKIPVDYLFWGDTEDQLPQAVARRLARAA